MRAFVGALLVALLGLLLGALVWREEELGLAYQPSDPSVPRFVDFPKFVMCGGSWSQRIDCSVRGLREVGRNDFAPAIAKQAQLRAAAGGRPLLLSIGSRDFLGDFYDYPEVLGNTTGVDYRLVLVEPDEEWHERIPESLARWAARFPEHHIPWDKAELVKAAVSRECKAETVAFYKMGQNAMDLLEADDPKYAQWTRDHFGANSLDVEWLKNDLKRDVLSRFNFEDTQPYVEKAEVPCLTPVQLVEKLGVELSDVVMMTVDAEGQDRDIVRILLQHGVRPAQIFFETNIVKQQNKWVVPVVQRAGYELGIHCDAECPRGASANLVAVHKDFYTEVP